jgi:hypothetical protein
MSIFTPPDLFAAVANAARGDDDLPDGIHLRLMPSPALGFPVMPFAIFAIEPRPAEPQILWRNGRGVVLPEPSLDAAEGVLVGDIVPPSASGDAIDLAVELVSDGSFEGSFELLDRVGQRVFSERTEPPLIVGGPRVDRVLIKGRGRVEGLRTWRVTASDVLEQMLGRDPIAFFSLPIDGSRPWYAGGLGRAATLDEVERGAPKRLNRPDRPDGPFDPLTPQDEVARIEAHATSSDIVGQCEQLVGDLASAPGAQRLQRQAVSGSRPQDIANVRIADTLLAQAMDPGLGRFLGLVASIAERSRGERRLAYVALGIFTYWSDAKAPNGELIETVLGPRVEVLDTIGTKLVERFDRDGVLQRLGERYSATYGTFSMSRATLSARPVIAVAGAVPPTNPPRLRAPAAGEAHWLPGNGGPSDSFRQEFLFPKTPLGALVALGRLEDGNWVSRYRSIAVSGPTLTSRTVAILLGRSRPTPKPIGPVPASGSYMRRGLISDAPIPATEPPVRYRAALADLFGRFGDPAEFDAVVPTRPRPPATGLELQVVLDGPDGIGGPATSPGHVNATVVVPSVAALANGSLDIAWLAITFDGVALQSTALAPIPAGATQTVTESIPLPALDVGKTAHSTVTAKFVDSAGVESEMTVRSVAYADRRQPPVVPTGLGLVWTSRPGPSPDVELKLLWPGAAETRYRVYIADQKSLGLNGWSRAAVAVAGGERDLAGTLGGRNRFRLLTEPPLEAAGATVMLNERLPRSLGTVQFVRVVPLTKYGREAEFESCGVVPVAVPSDRTPPPPILHVAVDPDTRIATIRIRAAGLDLVDLEFDEPGLFTMPPSPLAVPPEFRLRRASGLVPDPIYAREVARGPLQLTRDDDGNVTFVAEVDDPAPLGSFVRYSYWAEVRMPPERRLAAGIVEVPPAGGVGPARPEQIEDMPRPFSAASPPATALHLPELPVPTLEDPVAAAISEAGTKRAGLTAASTPSTPKGAVGTYRLRIWEQWGDKPIASAGSDVELDGLALAWEGTAVPDDADHPHPLTLRVVVIDPVGRESEMVTISPV